ncbi:MAG TPA: prepilin-type N-terminal cleavage/methylation domain-containing protein [Planctomycetota bacterium]|nr:prepilin-type N-terminal cleavage/methylation domain-containing protein [Planctomycetota bacterium]
MRPARGFSLLELVVVLAVLAALAGLVVPLVAESRDSSQEQATKVTLSRIRDVIMGSGERPGYYADLNKTPQKMADLFVTPTYLPLDEQSFNRKTGRGWRGPYIQNQSGTYKVNAAANFTLDYGSTDDPAVVDGWGNPVVIQKPEISGWTDEEELKYVRLVSAGPNQTIDTALDDANASSRNDDLVIFLRRADVP